MRKRVRELSLVLSLSISMLASAVCPAVPVFADEIQADEIVGISENGELPVEVKTAATAYKDGEYTGTGRGKIGDITVKVTIKNGKIDSIDVVSQNETPSFWKKALELFDMIVSHQSTEVDNISGATKSSEGIKTAVNDALSKAAVTIFESGNGTKKSPYVIKNPEQLAAFAESVDNGNPYTGEFIDLGADIDLSGIEDWNPIGTEAQTTKSVDTIFNGTFNGENHRITGLTIKENVTTAKSLGLFSTLNGSAVVENIVFDDVKIDLTASNKVFTGTVAGDTVAGSPVVDNISAEGSINISANTVKMTMNGGILGRAMRGASVLNCFTSLEQKNEDAGEYVNSYVAGIVAMGSLNNTLVNCGTSGSITNNTPASTGLTGGITGMYAGKMWNVYSDSSIKVVNSTGTAGFTGAIAGQLTTSGMSGDNYPSEGELRGFAYYASDADLSVSKTASDDKKTDMIPSGTGNTYDKAFEATALSLSEMNGESFASRLNGNIADVRKLMNAYKVSGRSLNKWIVSGDKIVLGTESAEKNADTLDFFESGSGTAEDPYIIGNSTQLRAFAESLSDTVDYSGKVIALKSDIDISDAEWSPIGGSDYLFNGTFDGKGYSINGMTAGTKDNPYDSDKMPYYGFFGILDKNAVVKNLSLKNIYINAKSSKSVLIGGVAGYMQGVSENNVYKGAKIDNVDVEGEITLVTESGNNYAAGIAGMQYKGSIINCTVDCDISGTVKDSSLAEAGGLVALCNRGLVANSSFYGKVYGSGSRILREGADEADEGMAIVSPLIACNAGSLVNCYASADITANEYSKYTGMVSGWVTGIGKAYRCWYDADKNMTVNGAAVSPVSAVGTIISKGVSDETFESYAGGLSFELAAVSGDDVKKASDGLNKSFSTLPVKIEDYGVESNSLYKWSWHEDTAKNLADGEAAEVTYVKPDVENRSEEVTEELMDGTWYGRSKDKSTVVKITTKSGKVTDTVVVSGSDSGDSFDEALEVAKNRAVYGDFTDYAQADTSVFDGGNGTEESPYLVSSESQLRYIAEAINEDVTWNGVWFRQTADINMSQEEFLPIGYALQQYNTKNGSIKTAAVRAFEGNYDGAGFTVSGLRIGNGKKYGHIFTNGMFGLTQGDYQDRFLHEDLRKVTIKNVHLKDVVVTTSNEYDTTAAALIGQGQNGTFIENCSVENSEIKASCDERSARVGGLAGSMVYGLIRDSWTDASVSAVVKKNFSAYVGGFIGITNRATIINCYTLGDVTAEARDYNKTTVGGFIGLDASTVVNCYTKGNVVSRSTTGDIGAFAGRTAGIATNKYDYYDSNSVVTVAGKNIEGIYTGADPYSLIKDNDTVGGKDTSEDSFVSVMNGNIDNMASVLDEIRAEYANENDQTRYDRMYIYYTGDGSDLHRWALINGTTVFTENNGNVEPQPVNPDTPVTPVTPAKEAYTEVTFPASDGSTVTLSKNNADGTYRDAEGDIAVVLTGTQVGTPDKKGTAAVDEADTVTYTYNGKKYKPGFKSYVVVDGKAYIFKRDYTVSVKNGQHAGKMTVTIKFKKNADVYKSGVKKIVVTDRVAPKTVSDSNVSFKLNKKGTHVTRVRDTELKKSIGKKNYTVDYTGKMITFKGDYAGTIKF
ncbi:FMN-binding domain-containing protein [Lachnospiraceae bacterium]|nr:FMN-binding domain-containing protein [Lachnospiraceae bacterium]